MRQPVYENHTQVRIHVYTDRQQHFILNKVTLLLQHICSGPRVTRKLKLVHDFMLSYHIENVDVYIMVMVWKAFHESEHSYLSK